MAKKLILIIGAPGSGKSTYTDLLSKKYESDITIIHVGDLLQKEINNKTTIGKIVEPYIKKGNLVPGSIIMHEVFGSIKNATNDIVFLDGFPRGINQMKEMGDTLFTNKDIELVSVIEFKVDKNVSRKRLLSNNPTKEEEKLFEHKIDVYNDLINTIEDYYNTKNLLVTIDANKDPESIISELDKYLKEKIKI